MISFKAGLNVVQAKLHSGIQLGSQTFTGAGGIGTSGGGVIELLTYTGGGGGGGTGSEGKILKDKVN